MWEEFNIEEIKGKYLYKFLSKAHLEKFLLSGDIWLSRADKFGDKLECVAIKYLKNSTLNLQEIEINKQKHFISCFHEATFESLAFWDTYAKNQEERRNYAIKINREYFCKIIENAFIPIEHNKISKMIHGKVVYKNLLSSRKEKLEQKKIKHVSMRKEYAFHYEREYRFVIKTKEIINSEGINIHLGLPTNLNFQILINPLLDNDDYKNANQFLEDINFKDRFELTKITKFIKPHLFQ